MRNELKLFENPEFGSVRVMEIDGESWFVGRDICKLFGDKNESRSLGRVDDADKQTIQITDAMGREQNAIIINESGLYSLLFAMQPQKANNGGVSDAYPIEVQQRIEKLRSFKRWVTHDVIPAIRKTGSYSLKDSYQIDDPIERAKRWIEEQQEKQQLKLTVSIQEQQINEMQPKVSYYDIILQCHDLVTTSQIAKDYGKSAQWLNNKLYNMGIQYPQNGTWLLYKQYQGEGYTQSRTGYKTDEFGDRHSYMHTCWTQKGRTFLYYMLKRDNVLPLIEQPERRRVLL